MDPYSCGSEQSLYREHNSSIDPYSCDSTRSLNRENNSSIDPYFCTQATLRGILELVVPIINSLSNHLRVYDLDSGSLEVAHNKVLDCFTTPLSRESKFVDLFERILTVGASALIIYPSMGVHIGSNYASQFLIKDLHFSDPGENNAIKDPNNHLLSIPDDIQNEIFHRFCLKEILNLSLLSWGFRNLIFSQVLPAYINAKKIPISDLRLNPLQIKNFLQKTGKKIKYLEHNTLVQVPAEYCISRCPSLTQLSLAGDRSFKLACVTIPYTSLKNITHLSLKYCHLSLQDTSMISSLTTLVSLDLEGSVRNVKILEFMEKLTKVKTLKLSYNHFGPVKGVGLAQALKKISKLTELHLKGNPIKKEGAEALALNLRHLTYLDIQNCSIDFEGIMKIVQTQTELTYLNISDNWDIDGVGPPLSHDQIQIIIDGVKSLKNLSVFKFKGTFSELFGQQWLSDDTKKNIEAQLLEIFPSCSVHL